MFSLRHPKIFYKALLLMAVSIICIGTAIPCFAFEDGDALPAYNKYLNQIYDTDSIDWWRSTLTYTTSSSTTNRFLAPSSPATYFYYERYVSGADGNLLTFSDTSYVDIDRISIDFTSPDPSNQIFLSDPFLEVNRYVTVFFRMVFENSFASIPPAGISPGITLTVYEPLSGAEKTSVIDWNKTNVSVIFPEDSSSFAGTIIFDVTCTFYVDSYLNRMEEVSESQYYKSIDIDFGDSFRFNMLSDELMDGAITTFQLVSSSTPNMKTPQQEAQTSGSIGDVFIQNEQQIQLDIENAKNNISDKPINDVVNTAAYKQIASMYQGFWEWSYLEALVLLVLTFGLLSFVLFGKK